MSDSRPKSLDPAASQGRMLAALAGLVVLGVLAWFTIDPAAVIHVHGLNNRYMGFDDREVPVRWLPILFLGLFGLRIVTANRRARFEQSKEAERLM
ncbi:MAG: hypothetical protein ACLGQX_09340 [Acidobacteriota bacterium]|jgi:hypothetical protein